VSAITRSGPAIRTQQLGKSYGTRWALRHVNLTVAPGEAVVVFGANGAGKSTLIRLLATLSRPSRGTLEILGVDAGRVPQQVRPALGLLGHQSYLYGDLSASENLVLYARLYGVPAPVPAAATALATVGLTAVGARPVRTLSRGMQQRLGLARATLHRPALLLLDEPDTGLDGEGRDGLARLVADGRAQEQTVVLTTHDIAWGVALCDRAVILDGGRVVYDAATAAHSGAIWSGLYQRTTRPRP